MKLMNLRACLLATTLLATIAIPFTAFAGGMTVFDPTNFAQNLLQAARALEQIQNQIQGSQAQVASVREQAELTEEEMAGYRTLHAKGYAPKQLILRYERSMAELTGRRGSLVADIARLKQQQGETRMQMVTMSNQRHSQAAEELRDAQAKLADMLPRLTAAKSTLPATMTATVRRRTKRISWA